MFVIAAGGKGAYPTWAAYIALARASLRLGGPAAARPLLEKAAQVAGSGRQTILPDLASAYAELGAINEALVLAHKVTKSRRTKTLGVLLFRARRWKDLTALLESIPDAESAVQVAWSITYEADPEANYFIAMSARRSISSPAMPRQG